MNRDNVLSILLPWLVICLGFISLALVAGYLARTGRRRGSGTKNESSKPSTSKFHECTSSNATKGDSSNERPLPLRTPTNVQAVGSAGSDSLSATGKPAPRLAGISILLTDDDVLVREMVRDVFMREGAYVETAASAREALKRLQSWQRAFDVALLDLQMQDMDGLTLTRLIRAMPHLRALPILAFTASTLECQRDEAFAAGMDGVIPKPFEIGPTVTLILQALQKRCTNAGMAVSESRPVAKAADNLPVLDVKQGLAYWSDHAFYLAYLKRFVRDHVETAQDLPELNPAALAELARDVRRTSRLLGMPALAAAAGELESALRRKAVTAPVLHGFTYALESARQAASHHVDESVAPKGTANSTQTA